MSFHYYWRILRRAFIDTVSFFVDLHDRKDFARSLFLPLVLLFLQWLASGFKSGLSGITIPLIYAAIGSLVIVFVAMLWFAPPRLHNQLTQRIATLESETKALRALQQPKMEIVYGSGNPFVELYPLDDLDAKIRLGTRRLHRIGVRNMGASTIRGVSVVLAEAQPGIMQALPIPLHRMHGEGGPVYDLDPGGVLYFEVLTTFEDTPNAAYRNSFAIEHSVNMKNYHNPLKEHRFRIEATGNDVGIASRYFLLRVLSTGLGRFGPE
jgi:hypothetical protein